MVLEVRILFQNKPVSGLCCQSHQTEALPDLASATEHWSSCSTSAEVIKIARPCPTLQTRLPNYLSLTLHTIPNPTHHP